MVDVSATGQMPLDMLRDLAPVAAHIVESGRPHVRTRALQIPRAEIVTALSVLLGERRLKIRQTLDDAETLARQLENLRVRPEAEDQLDLVHAAGLAIWWGLNRVRSQVPQPPFAADRAQDQGAHRDEWNEVLALEP